MSLLPSYSALTGPAKSGGVMAPTVERVLARALLRRVRSLQHYPSPVVAALFEPGFFRVTGRNPQDAPEAAGFTRPLSAMRRELRNGDDSGGLDAGFAAVRELNALSAALADRERLVEAIRLGKLKETGTNLGDSWHLEKWASCAT